MPVAQLREKCTKKFMILSLISLGLITILLLILENALTSRNFQPTPTPYTERNGARHASGNVPKTVKPESEQNQAVGFQNSPTEANSPSPCWLHESFDVIHDCSRCTEFEVNSHSPAACVSTGLKEQINCSKTGLVYRSCSRIPDIEKKKFLVFESLSLLLAILSYGFVKLRISQLERIEVKKIEKRLALG